jgi:AcrR family transcriptional regulator
MKAEKREAQLEALVTAAEKRIADNGLAGLKARDLAGDLGIALGGIYNIVADMEELALRVSSRTLTRLGVVLTEASAELPLTTPEEATARLIAIAHAYLGFARDHLNLWRTLFELRLTGITVLPEWVADDQLRLFRHIAEPLAVLVPEMPDETRVLAARTLFAAVHGIVTIGLEERLIAVPMDAQADQIAWLVRSTCRGLGARV